MSGVRDLFFDEFYVELEAAIEGYENYVDESQDPTLLKDELNHKWHPYIAKERKPDEVLISVDGGVQISRFAYGGFVAVARACALSHASSEGRRLTKSVKIHIQETYDNRDRGFIPSYARMISEYRAATGAVQGILEQGNRPVVLMDGSLYMGRFPYATREYRHHPHLIVELLDSVSELRALAWDHGFPLIGLSKDSTVFYLHMELLKAALVRAGLSHFRAFVDNVSTPFDLRLRLGAMEEQDRRTLEPFLDQRPLCDSALVHAYAESEGFTHPLLLSPIRYRQNAYGGALFDRIKRNLPREIADTVTASLSQFFSSPPVAVSYWKPTPSSRPFRVDIAGNSLGRTDSRDSNRENIYLDSLDPGAMEGIIDHLYHWYCNDVEYNIPLKQADTLARFDRNLYTSKYEPFIINRLERAGVDVMGARRNLREIGA